MHAVLRPAATQSNAGLRPGLPDRIDSIRADRRAAQARRYAAPAASRRRISEGPAVWRRRKDIGRTELVLPADGPAGSVWPAHEPQIAQPQRAAVIDLQHWQRDRGGP